MGGYPVPDLRGVPHPRSGVLHPRSDWGYPIPGLGGYPVPGPWGVPCPRSVGGYPVPDLRGVPYPRSGVPHPRSGGTPSQVWGGGVSHPDLGWGTPSQTWDGVPPQPDLGWGTPLPPASVDRHTDWCQNITFPRTTYAGAKNCSLTANQSVNCRTTTIFTISLNSAKT